MYAVTQSELDGRLSLLHLTWAYVANREADLHRADMPICKVDEPAQRPDGFHDRITDRKSLELVVSHYRELDKRLGLVVVPAPVARN